MTRTQQLAAAYDRRPEVKRNAYVAPAAVIQDRTETWAREVMQTLGISNARAWQSGL